MTGLSSKLLKLKKRAILAGAATSIDLFASGIYSHGYVVDLSERGQEAADVDQAVQDYQPAKAKVEEEVKRYVMDLSPNR